MSSRGNRYYTEYADGFFRLSRLAQNPRLTANKLVETLRKIEGGDNLEKLRDRLFELSILQAVGGVNTSEPASRHSYLVRIKGRQFEGDLQKIRVFSDFKEIGNYILETN